MTSIIPLKSIIIGENPSSSSSVIRQMNPETKATLETLEEEFPVMMILLFFLNFILLQEKKKCIEETPQPLAQESRPQKKATINVIDYLLSF